MAYQFPYTRVLLLFLAILGPFFFPWSYAVLLALGAGIFFPPITLIVGALLDTLYFGGKGLPYFTLCGLIATVCLHFVQQFIKARIMS